MARIAILLQTPFDSKESRSWLNRHTSTKFPEVTEAPHVDKIWEIPRFEFGGVVNRLMIPSVPTLAFGNGGSVAPQVEGVVRLDLSFAGRPVASIPGPRQQIRQVVDALKELERGMR